MNNQLPRTMLLAMLFLGCMVLAVPQWSQKLEHWLFESEATSSHKPISPAKLAAAKGEQPREQQALYIANAGEQRSLPPQAIPLSYEETVTIPHATQLQPGDFSAQQSSFEQPIKTANADLLHWQQKLEQLGAKYVVVDLLEDRYQCRCLMPLASDSAYEKAFAAEDSDPARAMQAVADQVKMWQAQKAEQWEQQKIRALRR